MRPNPSSLRNDQTVSKGLDGGRVLVVIPAFQEATRIRDVIEALRCEGLAVLVVDDGSRDATSTIARSAGADVLRHAINLGQGAALATGLQYAAARGFEYVVTFDADGQHDAGDVRPAVCALHESGADVLLGSRFLGEAVGLSRSRRLLLRAALLFTRLATGLRVTDTHNGFRVFRNASLPLFCLRQNRMAHASEVLHIIAKHRLRFIEFPNRVTYTKDTLAKGQKPSEALGIVADLVRGRLYK